MSSTRDCMAAGCTASAMSSSWHTAPTHSSSVLTGPPSHPREYPVREAGDMQHTRASHFPQTHFPQTYFPQRSRMTTGQQRAWDRSWDRWGVDVVDLPDGPLDTAGWFGRTAPVVLEIGSGMGESTAAMAVDAPDVDHLAVEVYRPGLAQLLLRIEQAGITNLRLLRGDAQTVLTEHIAPGALHAVRIYFPDPWPKNRHHKRRLVRPEFIALVTSRLEPGGIVHLATDWEPYAAEMLTV